jgi:hypothetical protein
VLMQVPSQDTELVEEELVPLLGVAEQLIE